MLAARTGIVLTLVMGLVAAASAGSPPAYVIDTYAGAADTGDGGPALNARLKSVEGIAADRLGNLYICDTLDHRLRRVDVLSGRITTLAGNGLPGFSGDGGPAAEAQLNSPYGVAVGEDGSVYVADFGNARVRRISPDGVIDTVAGGGTGVGNPRTALAARLKGPRNVAVGPEGNLYISDFADHLIYRVSPSGSLSVLTGNGSPGFLGPGLAAGAPINAPAGIVVAPDGTVYFADTGNNRVRRVRNGYISTVAGGGIGGVELLQPTGVALDEQGTVYIADAGNRRVVLRFTNGSALPFLDPYGKIGVARDVVFAGRLLVAGGGLVLSVSGSGAVDPVAGGQTIDIYKDGIDAYHAALDAPIGLGFDRFDRLLVVDEQRHRVRMIGVSETILTVAGSSKTATSGDGDLAIRAGLLDPVAVTVDTLGRTWIADYQGNVVRRVSLDGTIHTVAGDGTPGYTGDGGLARNARLNRPRALAPDPVGGVYVADSSNHRIRRIDPNGMISTVAGIGIPGDGGDYGLAVQCLLDSPAGLAVGPDGSLYVADTARHRVRRIRPDGMIIPAAGNGAAGYSGDGAAATAAQLNHPNGLSVDAEGNLLIADTNNNRVRRVSTDGIIDTIAGVGEAGFSGDGELSLGARLNAPAAVAVAPDGVIYIADMGNRRIRRLRVLSTDPVEDPVRTLTVLHAATYQAGAVAPGQIAALFGEGIGPEAPGAVLEVRVEGAPAPIFFAGANQLNIQVPYAIAGLDEATFEVRRDGRPVARGTNPVAPSAPGLFTVEGGLGQAAAVNENGQPNSKTNPAPRGSVVTLFATGEGVTQPAVPAGSPAGAPLPRPVLPVEATVSGISAEVLYAGAAPGFAGLMQLNIRVPAGYLPSGAAPVVLRIGDAESPPGVTIEIR